MRGLFKAMIVLGGSVFIFQTGQAQMPAQPQTRMTVLATQGRCQVVYDNESRNMNWNRFVLIGGQPFSAQGILSLTSKITRASKVIDGNFRQSYLYSTFPGSFESTLKMTPDAARVVLAAMVQNHVCDE